jgi:dCMP deaminase
VRPDWDQTWMAVAGVIALRSRCRRDQVGAVLISPDQRVLATGYNGQPSGFPEHCVSCPRHLKSGEGLDDFYSDCTAIHAEANCLLYSDSTKRRDGTLYVTRAPCWGCCKIIANSGVQSVVLPRSSAIDPRVAAYLATSGLRVRTV